MQLKLTNSYLKSGKDNESNIKFKTILVEVSERTK